MAPVLAQQEERIQHTSAGIPTQQKGFVGRRACDYARGHQCEHLGATLGCCKGCFFASHEASISQHCRLTERKVWITGRSEWDSCQHGSSKDPACKIWLRLNKPAVEPLFLSLQGCLDWRFVYKCRGGTEILKIFPHVTVAVIVFLLLRGPERSKA